MAKKAILKALDFKGAAADAARPFFMSEELQARFAERLNLVVNIPGLGEQQEGQIILKVVQSLDRNTFKFIPREILDVAFDKGQGLPSNIVDALRVTLPVLLADLIPLPFVPTFVKQAIIGAFVNQLLGAFQKGVSLNDMLKPD